MLSSMLAEIGTGPWGSRTGRTEREAARVPHQVDGSAAGTSATVAGGLRGEPGEPAGRRLAQREGLVRVGGDPAQLGDEPAQRERPGRGGPRSAAAPGRAR